MTTYKLRFLDGLSGSAAHEVSFDAEDDTQAVRLADGRRGLAPMELLRGKQVINRWPSFPPSSR